MGVPTRHVAKNVAKNADGTLEPRSSSERLKLQLFIIIFISNLNLVNGDIHKSTCS